MHQLSYADIRLISVLIYEVYVKSQACPPLRLTIYRVFRKWPGDLRTKQGFSRNFSNEFCAWEKKLSPMLHQRGRRGAGRSPPFHPFLEYWIIFYHPLEKSYHIHNTSGCSRLAGNHRSAIGDLHEIHMKWRTGKRNIRASPLPFLIFKCVELLNI